MAVNCDPSSLANAARCFGSCGKGPIDQSIKTYLLCQISNTGGVVSGPTNPDLADNSTFASVFFTWTNPTPAGDTNEIWKSTDGGVTFVLYATVAGTVSSYHDIAVPVGNVIWSFKVRTMKSGIPSAFSASRSWTSGINKTGAADVTLSYPDLVFELGLGGSGILVNNMPNLTSFSAPLLRRVDDQFNFSGSAVLASVSLPVLDNVGETNSDNFFFDNCTALTSLNLPTFKRVGGSGGNFHLSGCSALASVSLPALITTGGDFLFDNCTSLPSMSCPSLTGVAEALSGHDNIVMTTASFPVLLTVGTDLSFNANAGLTTLNTPVLNDVGGIVSLQACFAITSYSFPLLANINGSLNIFGCTSLQTINFPVLATVAGDIIGTGSQVLTAVNLPALTSCQNMTFDHCLGITSVSIPNVIFGAGTAVIFRQASIPVGNSAAGTGIDGILRRAIASAYGAGTGVNLTGGGNATPDAPGQADKATLIGNGCACTTN